MAVGSNLLGVITHGYGVHSLQASIYSKQKGRWGFC